MRPKLPVAVFLAEPAASSIRTETDFCNIEPRKSDCRFAVQIGIEMYKISGPRTFRSLLNHEPVIRCLGCYDVLSAKLIEQAGLETVFVGGFGCSASYLAQPDMNVLTLSNMADIARHVCNQVRIPVIVDGDTGHGDLHNVERTIRIFEQIGAAGIMLEDQTTPKRCGHFEGKRVIPTREMVLKIMAAREARENNDLVIIARTDALAVNGMDDAIDRARRYADAGADVCYIEAPTTEEELAIIPEKVKHPLMINMLAGGRTPIKSVDELRQLGYKIVLCSIDTVLAVAHTIQKLTHTLIEKGRLDGLANEMITFQEMQVITGLPEVLDIRSRLDRKLVQQEDKK